MVFTETDLQGAYLVEIERLEDFRGFFARTWCAQEFAAEGLIAQLSQCSISFNKKQGTLRGMHYQAPPCREGKLVRCTSGSIFDAIVDLRPGSKTYLQYYCITLSATTRNALYIPPGFAHGFQTLEDGSEIFYQMTEAYDARYASGFRWNDPAFGIPWPEDNRVIFERDRHYPDFDPDKIKGFTDY